MQTDPKFNESVEYLINQLRLTQLSQEGWSDKIGSVAGVDCKPDSVRAVASEFAGESAVADKFDLNSLSKSLEDRVSSDDSVVLSVGELQASSLQNQAMLAIRRYYSRRKTPRSLRIVHAAYRRAILTHPKGPIARDLRRAVEHLLAESR